MSDRDDAIARIRAALRRRSGKDWTVRGGRGTAWGWITIDAPPRRRTWTWPAPGEPPVNTGRLVGYMGPDDAEELRTLLGLDYVHPQGVSIPSSNAHRREYMERAEAGFTTKIAACYWD
jgi:hypothetical protein